MNKTLCKQCGKNKTIKEFHYDFCSKECEQKYHNIPCRNCGIIFFSFPRSQKYCPECRKDKNLVSRNSYKKRLKEKNCEECKKPFLGTDKQKLCEICGKESKKRLIHSYETIERDVVDQNGNFIKKELVKKSFRTKEKRIVKKRQHKYKNTKKPIIIVEVKIICPRCKKIIIIKNVEKKYNTKLEKNGHVCDECKEKIKKDFSNRMKSNNPMFNKEISKKVSITLHNNAINFPKGVNHKSYKGNRGFNLEIRSRLYKPWIFKVLEKYNFMCSVCGSKKELHIHHLKPLRDIIKEVLEKENISKIKLNELKENKEQKYENLILKIIENHKLEDGICFCKQCHHNSDFYYRGYKGIKKNENK